MKNTITYKDFTLILRESGLFMSDKMWVPEEKNERVLIQASIRTLTGEMLCFKNNNTYKEVTATARSLTALSTKLWEILTDPSKKILVGQLTPENLVLCTQCIELGKGDLFILRDLTGEEIKDSCIA